MRDVYLGIDLGSVGAKFVLIDNNVNIIKKVYLNNKNIIETVEDGLRLIEDPNLNVIGVGCTGSGREFTKILVGADLIKTEILAHTIATLHYYPCVNTIFDIGGEDGKIITLENGVWTNYVMNNICGAGTGSVIENIARLLNVGVEDVGELCMKSRVYLNFPGKCGVLCQSAVVSKKNKGARKEDILMGVCRAVINTYLTLAKSFDLKSPFVFQGMTAKNKGLVKALEEQLKEEVFVHKDCEFMGAIGIALLVKENNIKHTKFKGFDIHKNNLELNTYNCNNCNNNCEVTQIKENNITHYLDNKCGKVFKK